MEDLRKNNNVKNRRPFNLYLWWYKNKNVIQLMGLISLTVFILARPDIIGSFIGKWINSIVTSFSSEVNISISQWSVILITVLIFGIVYRLTQWRNKG